MGLEGANLIWSRVALDVLALALLLATTVTQTEQVYHAVLFPLPYILTLLTAGLTNRWTLTFPMVPLLVLQAIRFIPYVRQSRWLSVLILVLSLLLIVISTALCTFFPPLKLPPVSGPYQVGVADFHIPIDADKSVAASTTKLPSRVSVRLLYPTKDLPGRGVPYLDPALAKEYCRQTMLFGAPPPLKKFGGFLHYWRFIRLPVKRHATLVTEPALLPVIIYSHGLGGSSDMYAYQAMALAAQGYVVLSINHSDGSAPAILLSDGSIHAFDHEVAMLADDGHAYVRRRREQADHRTREFLAATEAFLQLNDGDNLELVKAGISLRGRLDQNVTFMGHSFGGATALSASARRPDMVHQVVAHEPAVDWMTDDARQSLFAKSVMMGLTHSYSGGTAGYTKESDGEDNLAIHKLDLLIMYSYEWQVKKWGEAHVVEELFMQGRLGRQGGSSHFQVIKESFHMEFSDVAMLTPTWLARATGQVGKRDPVDSAAEIERHTMSWLSRVRSPRAAETDPTG